MEAERDGWQGGGGRCTDNWKKGRGKRRGSDGENVMEESRSAAQRSEGVLRVENKVDLHLK